MFIFSKYLFVVQNRNKIYSEEICNKFQVKYIKPTHIKIMDIGWDVPPEEDIDALLADEDELEYIREIELQNKQKEVLDIEKLLETNYQVIISSTQGINNTDNRRINHCEGNILRISFAFFSQKNPHFLNWRQNPQEKVLRNKMKCTVLIHLKMYNQNLSEVNVPAQFVTI